MTHIFTLDFELHLSVRRDHVDKKERKNDISSIQKNTHIYVNI